MLILDGPQRSAWTSILGASGEAIPMKQLLVLFLNLYGGMRRFFMRLRGRTQADVHADRITSGKAWEDFCDTLKAAGNTLIMGNSPKDPFNQAEGMRYLARLTRAGLDAFVEFNDPEFPVLNRMVHETVKLGADNPDNHYQNAQIDGRYEYRITGQRNDIFYLGFFTQNGSYGTTGGLAPCGQLEAEDMHIEADGRFEVILSKEQKGRNWLKIEDDTSLLMVRQTFMDRSVEKPADVHVQCIGGPDKPAPITPQLVDEGLNTAGLFVAGATALFARWANGFQKHANRLPQFDPAVSTAAGGDKNIAYYHSYWKLGDDEALVIEAMPPECRHWNFQLNNYWMESLDYRYSNIHVNKHTAHYRPDGSVRVVVAHQDPGLPNWIDTCHHREGTMLWRWWYGSSNPEPQCRLLRFSELSGLPE
jgi:hypothetical protein